PDGPSPCTSPNRELKLVNSEEPLRNVEQLNNKSPLTLEESSTKPSLDYNSAPSSSSSSPSSSSSSSFESPVLALPSITQQQEDMSALELSLAACDGLNISVDEDSRSTQQLLSENMILKKKLDTMEGMM